MWTWRPLVQVELDQFKSSAAGEERGWGKGLEHIAQKGPNNVKNQVQVFLVIYLYLRFKYLAIKYKTLKAIFKVIKRIQGRKKYEALKRNSEKAINYCFNCYMNMSYIIGIKSLNRSENKLVFGVL